MSEQTTLTPAAAAETPEAEQARKAKKAQAAREYRARQKEAGAPDREDGEGGEALPAPAQPPAWACVGRAVQYSVDDGTVVPAFLQSRMRTEGGLWNVKVSLDGVGALVMRPGVRYSPVPRPGHWSPLPE